MIILADNNQTVPAPDHTTQYRAHVYTDTDRDGTIRGLVPPLKFHLFVQSKTTTE